MMMLNSELPKAGRIAAKVSEIVVVLMTTDAILSVALCIGELWTVTSLPLQICY
jgi:hypothetical protein